MVCKGLITTDERLALEYYDRHVKKYGQLLVTMMRYNQAGGYRYEVEVRAWRVATVGDGDFVIG